MAVRFVVSAAEGQDLKEEVSYGFEQARIAIGRGAAADVRIPHLTVSELHATVRLHGESYAIEDHGSTNGTLVNGTALSQGRSKRLVSGDRIEIGTYALTFHADVALSHTTTLERTAELARRLFRQSQAGAALAAPRLVLLSGKETGKSLNIPAPPVRLLIGQADSCQLVLLDDARVAREHAEVIRDLDGVLIKSLDSKTGIVINEQRIAQRRLRDGDELLIGTTRLLFEEPAEEPIDALASEADRAVARASGAGRAPSQDGEATSVTAQEPARPIRKRPLSGSPSFDADVLIYALAAIVIGMSTLGLIALLRAD